MLKMKILLLVLLLSNLASSSKILFFMFHDKGSHFGLAARGHKVTIFQTHSNETKDFGPNVGYIKAYLPPDEPPEILAYLFWKLSISVHDLPPVYKACNGQLGTLIPVNQSVPVSNGQTITFKSFLYGRTSRMQLSKLPQHQLHHLCQQLSQQVALANAQLVELLIEKDALHMQRDSILVDIQDLRSDQEDLSTLVLHLLQELREALNQDWDLVVIDDLFWTLGFSFATLRHRLWEKGLLPNSSPKFVVYATAGQTLLSADSVKSLGRNWVSKISMFPENPTNQQDYFQAKYFTHRLLNSYPNLVDLITINFYVEKFVMSNIEKFGVSHFTWHELYKKSSLVFADSLDRLGWPLAEGDDIVNVGAHCKVALTKPLSGDLAKFVEDPKSKGTIYIAFGTYANWDFAPQYIVDAFVDAVNRLEDYRVIWGYNGQKSLPVKSHIKLVNWVPQLDVLAHPKTKAFITHGGLKSIKEGLCVGKPLIFMPLFAEQAHNAHTALAWKIGPVLNKYTLNQQVVHSTIYEVVSNPAREERAKRLRSLFLDRPLEGMDTAVFYTERLLRVPADRRINFVRKGMDLNWLQFLHYDLILAVLALIFVVKN